MERRGRKEVLRTRGGQEEEVGNREGSWGWLEKWLRMVWRKKKKKNRRRRERWGQRQRKRRRREKNEFHTGSSSVNSTCFSSSFVKC